MLDTHVYLWWCEDSSALSHKARTLIKEAETVYSHVAVVFLPHLSIAKALPDLFLFD